MSVCVEVLWECIASYLRPPARCSLAVCQEPEGGQDLIYGFRNPSESKSHFTSIPQREGVVDTWYDGERIGKRKA